MSREDVSEASYSLPNTYHGDFDCTCQRQQDTAEHPDGREVGDGARKDDEHSKCRDEPGKA